MNSFSTLIEKLAKDSTSLTAMEKQEIVLQAKQLENAASAVNGMIVPGTSTLKVDNAIINSAKITNAEILTATTGNGDVVLDGTGVTVRNNQEATLKFQDKNGNRDNLYIWSGLSDELNMSNVTGDGKIKFAVLNDVDGTTPYLMMERDPADTSRFWVHTGEGVNGVRLQLGEDALIDMRTQGSSGGSTFIRVRETTVTPPSAGNDAFHMYMKGDKFIITSNGKYWYLDLTTSSNQSWIYSATAP